MRISGNRAFGQLTGAFAVREGVRAAKTYGIAASLLTNSGHMGRNGKWPELAADHGVASLHFVNAPLGPSSVAPFDGAIARLTNNPIALGVPRADGTHLIADFASGEFSTNAILLALERGEKMPSRSIVKADGTLSDNPRDFVGSHRTMVGFGGYKGFAIGLFSEILAGALTGGGVHTQEGTADPANNMLSIYLDVASLTEQTQYEENMRLLINWIESTPSRRAGSKVISPGGRSRAIRQDTKVKGIVLHEGMIATLISAAQKSGDFAAFNSRWPKLFANRSA